MDNVLVVDVARVIAGMVSMNLQSIRAWIVLLCCTVSNAAAATGATAQPLDSEQLSQMVTIHRDEWGVPHILGPTDECVVFGMGYAQAEDYFWQLEDTTIRGLGRYAEVYGPDGIKDDLLNHAFEVVPRSQADYERLPAEHRLLLTAFTGGINWYLERHPETPTRLLNHFEPWMVMAVDRHILLDFTYGRTHAGNPQPLFDTDPLLSTISNPTPLGQATQDAIGSNAWAIGPSKTASGHSMLLINPHQPWFGWGQFYEAHLHSQETIRFSGACFLGTPLPTIGHNEHLGWTYTVNTPDNADAWKMVFDSTEDPLAYRYDEGYEQAVEWRDSLSVLIDGQVEQRSLTFRKTHLGPLVKQLNPTTYLSANVAGIFDSSRFTQILGMVRANNLEEWKTAMGDCALPMFNVAYADDAGNILYLYNGSIPIRDPAYNWRMPVDGTRSATQWQGLHSLDELPQLLNPKCGYVQSCNTSPFNTTLDENPDRSAFPAYMFEDADHEKRRAKLSRKILSELSNVTFDQFSQLALDSRLYWPSVQLPVFQRELQKLGQTQPELARSLAPYLEHLLDWDCVAGNDSTQTTLCVTWYEELHEGVYPGEELKPQYDEDLSSQLAALGKAAEYLNSIHGDWKVPWGDVHRLQRVPNKPDVDAAAFAFNSLSRSLPCPGAPGPLGVVFTVYSVPSVPFLRPARYAVVGSCYVGVVEFGARIRAASAVQFGASANTRSPHYFDQAELFSQQQLKPAWFYPDDVLANAVHSYHPGE